MFDIAWTEMLVLLVIAIVVIGPKDLPKVMRTMGGWMRKARGLASEFRLSMDELAREADLDNIRKNAAAAAAFDPNQAIKKALDPTGGMAGETDGLLVPPAVEDDRPDSAAGTRLGDDAAGPEAKSDAAEEAGKKS